MPDENFLSDGHHMKPIEEAGWKQGLRDTIAGILGGAAGKILEHPFDTLKVLRQSELMHTGIGPKYKNNWDCFKRIMEEEGVKGLYRGMAAPLLGTIVETSCLFLTNGALKRWLTSLGDLKPDEELPMKYVLLAGAGTGFVVSFVLTPVELVKCRLQIQSPGVPRLYKGPMDCFRKSIKNEGLPVVYRGHVGTMLREVPGTACWFGAYETFVRWMTPAGTKREDLNPWIIITAGALGGFAYWGIMYPSDTVKSAMQCMQFDTPATNNAGKTAHAAGSAEAALASLTSAKPSFLRTTAYIYRTEGIRGLYAGLLPTMVRAAPSNAAIFWVYEVAVKGMKSLEREFQ